MLNLTIATFANITHDKFEATIVLDKYEGWTSSMSAPDWTRRKPGRQTVFRQTKGELAEFLKRVEASRTNMKVSPCSNVLLLSDTDVSVVLDKATRVGQAMNRFVGEYIPAMNVATLKK